MTSREPPRAAQGVVLTRRARPARVRSGRHAWAAAHYWPPVLLLALLIILGMAGLRGSVTGLRWNGPLWQDRVAVGIALEIILGILLAITLRRRAVALRARRMVTPRGPDNIMAAKLRTALILVLGPGMVAALVVIVNTLHPRGKSKVPYNLKGLGPGHRLKGGKAPKAVFNFPLVASLYGLLIVVLVAAVLVSIWWSRQFRMVSTGT